MTVEQRLEQRAKEPVAACLVRRLTVPRIFFDAPWPSAEDRVDLLAIDRAGTGDVHVVEIKRRADDALRAIHSLMGVPAQFRWIAFFNDSVTPSQKRNLSKSKRLFPLETSGRIGVIEVVKMENGELGANKVIAAERFPGTYRQKVKAFVASHEADISFE